MGFLDSVISHAVHNVVGSSTHEIGKAMGEAAGNMMGQAAENITTDMRLQNEQKIKEKNLPAVCPHCGGPTNERIVCEYCGCKIVE